MIELFHSAVCGEDETTYLGDSFMKGAPGSSSAVRVDQAGANSSKVRRPSKMALLDPMICPMASAILGSKEESNVQGGASITPSNVMNSCTPIVPTVNSFDGPVRIWPARTNGPEHPSRRRRSSPWRGLFDQAGDDLGLIPLHPVRGIVDEMQVRVREQSCQMARE